MDVVHVVHGAMIRLRIPLLSAPAPGIVDLVVELRSTTCCQRTKTTGSLSRSSSTMKMTSLNTSPGFFLRPHLTREDTGSLPYAPEMPQDFHLMVENLHVVILQSAAVAPVKASAKIQGCVPKPCDPPKNASSTNSGIRRTKANANGCHYPTNTSPNLKGASESIFRDKRCVETSCPARSGPPTRCMESNYPSRSPNNSTGRHLESGAAELRRMISERYLCGDKSFEESLSALVSPTRHENSQTESADLCDSTGIYGAHPELSLADSCPVKRKSTSELSEHDCYPQRKRKRQCVGDDVNGIHDAQASNETIDLNDTLGNFLNSYGKDTSFKINASRGTRRSRAMTRSRGMAKTRMQGRTAWKYISTITSGSQCDNNRVKKPGSESFTRAMPLIDLTDGIADAAVKSRVLQGGDQAPNDENKARVERKDIGEVIKTAKPVQRMLLKNSRSSLYGSYALDYDSLPKLISVLSSPMAVVASTFQT
ncbi:hypothetical protein OS493_022841 [Desmophyllum pertusum]|uniref:Uncharacterized protein n=1 Tax=Desmophyllum pertusum TaxID=174260 RepID=A0A9W9ZM29_9CNID|nr:hypothetical protein OS493_022841 [Desmophyllum pertusum]